MKNIIKSSFAVVLGLALLTGCIKEVFPQGEEQSDSVIVTYDQANSASGSFDNFVDAITNSLTGSFLVSGTSNTPYDFGYPSFYLSRDVMGNDFVVEDSTSEWYSSWYTCASGLAPNGSRCSLPWTYYYTWIKSCNTVIEMAGEEPEESRITGAGIAYCMRAMFYMDLARMYANSTYAINKDALTVPIVLETTEQSDLQYNPNATSEEIWALIMSDLDKAEEYLADYKRSDKYTPDLSVVYGLKARAYLTMEDWPNAQSYAKKAQEGYSVLTEEEYRSQTSGFNTPTNAWMFGLTYRSNDENILRNDADSCWGSQMIIEVSESECGYAANYGGPKHIDRHLYESIPDTDFRKKCFVDFAIDELATDDDKIDALIAYSDSPKGLLTTAQASKSGAVGGLCVKFRPKDGEHYNQYLAFVVAVPIMRVEEMMLIEAEAAGMQNEGNGISLLTAFAQQRDPSYVYGTHSSETYNSDYATAFQNEVWWQRRVELWGEGFATFDIKRLNKEVIRSYPNTNHTSPYRFNAERYGGYSPTEGTTNLYPNWMDLCIPESETNYNFSCVTNNPGITRPSTSDSEEYVW